MTRHASDESVRDEGRRWAQFGLRHMLLGTAIVASLVMGIRSFWSNQSQQGWSPGFKSYSGSGGFSSRSVESKYAEYYAAAYEQFIDWLGDQGFERTNGPPEAFAGPLSHSNWYVAAGSRFPIYITVRLQQPLPQMPYGPIGLEADVCWYIRGWPTDIQHQKARSEMWAVRLAKWWAKYRQTHPPP